MRPSTRGCSSFSACVARGSVLNGAGAIALIAFAVDVAITLVMLRTLRNTSPAMLAVTSSIAGYVVAFIGALVLAPGLSWPVTTVYWFFASAFLMGFGAIYKSISLRILLQLRRTPNRAMESAALFRDYVVADSFENRLQVLLHQGLAEMDEEHRFRATSKGRAIASLVRAAHRLFKIEHTG